MVDTETVVIVPETDEVGLLEAELAAEEEACLRATSERDDLLARKDEIFAGKQTQLKEQRDAGFRKINENAAARTARQIGIMKAFSQEIKVINASVGTFGEKIAELTLWVKGGRDDG